MMALPACKHVFHADCMASWLRIRHTCPLCVGRVTASRVRQTPHHLLCMLHLRRWIPKLLSVRKAISFLDHAHLR